MAAEATNSINYACECGRKWTQGYQMEFEGREVLLTRIVPTGAPGDDRLCTCGRTADADFETPMPGYERVRVRLLAVIYDTPRYSEPGKNQQFEDLVQVLIEQEKPIRKDEVKTIEEKAHKIVKLGLTADKWQALSQEQREAALKLQP